MEFDTNGPVTDDQRRLAESKKITLQPVHGDIAPEELPDAEIAAHHLNAPAIANIENDTEQNATPIQPSSELLSRPEIASSSKGFTIAIVAAAIGSALLLGTFLLFT